MTRIIATLSALLLIVVTLVLLPVQMLAHWLDRPLARRLPVWWHRFALARVGARVREIGEPTAQRPLLLAANHASWLDIPVLGSRMPLSFVAKSEVRGWPIFGLFARLQRCIFVERQRRATTGRTASDLGGRLAAGDAMVLFPEGTSSDGSGILPFRSSLIGATHAAIAQSGAAVVWTQPVAIRYRGIYGLPVGRLELPRLAWYGDMDLLPHLKLVFGLSAIDIDVIWGAPVPVDAATDRKVVTRELEAQVRTLFLGR